MRLTDTLRFARDAATGYPMRTTLSVLAMSIGVATEMRADSDIRFRRLSTDDGLSHDVVYATVQDHRGFLWIGTGGGNVSGNVSLTRGGAPAF